jgi:signal transduction histidine kinase
MLDELGLVPTLRWFTRRFADRSGVEVDFRVEKIDEERLESAIETALYRVVQESLTNVVRHAEAERVQVDLIIEPDRVVVRIEDDGEDWDPVLEDDSDGHLPGLGLLGMKERVSSLGGVFTAERCDGGGVRIDVEVPLSDTTG